MSGKKGRASSSFCVNGGSIKLSTQTGRSVLLKTNCKTWSCLGCRNRMISLFRARVITGVSRLGRCAFITITYKEGLAQERGAAYVHRDWVALWRRLRLARSPLRLKKWIRVVELTVKGTPHHHLILGPIGIDEVISCMPRRFSIVRFRKRAGSCNCIAHEFSRHWEMVTGDSYIVHGREVVGVADAASYLSKYLKKSFLRSNREERLGMLRRWSSSRGWPGNAQLRLRYTEEREWAERQFRPGRVDPELLGGPDDLMVRVGEDLVRALRDKTADKRNLMELQRMTHDTNVR